MKTIQIVLIIALARMFDTNQLCAKTKYYESTDNEMLKTLYRSAEGLKTYSYRGSIVDFDKVVRNDNVITREDIRIVENGGWAIELHRASFFNVALPSIIEFAYNSINMALDFV